MYLAGYHKVNLVWPYIKGFKIDGMRTSAMRKKYQMVKGMAVRRTQVFVAMQIGRKAAYQNIVLPGTRDGVYIVNRCALYHTPKVNTKNTMIVVLFDGLVVLFTDL